MLCPDMSPLDGTYTFFEDKTQLTTKFTREGAVHDKVNDTIQVHEYDADNFNETKLRLLVVTNIGVAEGWRNAQIDDNGQC